MEKILSIVIIHGGVYGQNVLQEWLEIHSVSRDGLLLLNVSLQVSGLESQSLGQESVK
jgi:hypothetical protein